MGKLLEERLGQDGGRRRAQGHLGRGKFVGQPPVPADQDLGSTRYFEEEASGPFAEPPGRHGIERGGASLEQFAAHPEKVVAKVRKRLAAARRKDVAALEPRDMCLRLETVPYRLVSDTDLLLLLLGGVLGGCGEGAGSGDGVVDSLGSGLRRAGGERTGPYSSGMALDRTGRSSLCTGGATQGSEMQSPAQDAGRPSLGNSELGIPPGRGLDRRANQQRAWTECPTPQVNPDELPNKGRGRKHRGQKGAGEESTA